ncbi:MAG: shikimate dehydrogenase [Pyrinomonadaceae bacterium]|nr:shikimate dehydrogenase [Pyrinomonadaceae bacterium]
MNAGKLCISVAAKTADELAAQIERAAAIGDIVEIRFDDLDRSAISQISDLKLEISVIATYRSDSREARLAFWNDQNSSFWACDLEEDIYASVACQRKIASFHDHEGIPNDLANVYARLAALDADIVKIAVTANAVTDAIPVWKLLDRAASSGQEIIPIAMGEAGTWTRILGLAHGAFLTYASLDQGKETADGQMTARDMLGVYRVKELDRETRVYGVIGDPVSQSLSPYMQNAAFAAVGENAVFLHLPVRDLDEFLMRMVKPATREVDLNFAGFSVTMPHKLAIMRHLDGIDPMAEAVGAVNTVKIGQNGRLIGYNTDVHGIIAPLTARYGELSGARIAVLGAGGAARACVYGLKAAGAKPELFVRDPRNANALATEFAIDANAISDLSSKISNFDVVINATPVGMEGELVGQTLLTADELSGVKFVYDLVTRPDGTALQHAAAEAGIPCIGGIEMLIAQGAKQFEIWTGREAPLELMREAILERIGG